MLETSFLTEWWLTLMSHSCSTSDQDSEIEYLYHFTKAEPILFCFLLLSQSNSRAVSDIHSTASNLTLKIYS
jgi:hypothetical protein